MRRAHDEVTRIPDFLSLTVSLKEFFYLDSTFYGLRLLWRVNFIQNNHKKTAHQKTSESNVVSRWL